MKINEKTLIKVSTNSAISPDMEGFLLKKGDSNKVFQKRWCILKGNMFFYFDKKTDKEPLGCILLEGSRIELADSEMDHFSFKIVFSGNDSRDYTFATDSSNGLEKWMKALSQAPYSYLKMVVAELQRQLDDINMIETRRGSVNSIHDASVEKVRVNPFNQSTDLIDLESGSQSSIKHTLFSKKPFVEIHQDYGVQFRNYLAEQKKKRENASPKIIDLLS